MLSSLAKIHPARGTEQVILSSLRPPGIVQSDTVFVLNTLGQLWLSGVTVDWSGFYAYERRQRLPLPTYPFQRQHYWVEPSAPSVPPPQADNGRPAPPVAPAADVIDTIAGVRASDADHGTPGTRIQALVAETWQDVLGVPHIGLHDDFFELGGNSILITEVIARLNEIFHVDLSALNLLESPTVAGLSECIEAVYRLEQGALTPSLE
jgi:acyl carrier protein